MAERKAGGAEELRRTLTGNMIKAMSMHSHNHMRSAMEQLGASIRVRCVRGAWYAVAWLTHSLTPVCLFCGPNPLHPTAGRDIEAPADGAQ